MDNRSFQESWRLATIIPIPEEGKDHAEPTNSRPITLTSCLCKTLERMLNKRLVWYLESNNLITKFQSGFWAERSTKDNLARLETFIRDAFIKREHVVAVFFDLEKAYDTTWRYGILKDLHNFGLKGRLPNFIESFLLLFFWRSYYTSACSIDPLWPIWSGAGRSSRNYTFSHFIQCEIKRYYKLSGL